MKISRPVRRGQIWWVNWNPNRGSEQAGRRPALVFQADFANGLEEYDLTIVLAMSSSGHEDIASHIQVEPSSLNGLSKPGFVKCEQIMTISKSRLDGLIGVIEPRYLAQIEIAVKDLLSLS